MPDWNPRANDLFVRALDVPEPDRSAFLAAACGDDADLLRSVNALLAAHARAGGFLAAPHPDAAATRTGDGHPTRAFDPTATRPGVEPAADRHPDLAPPGYEIVRPLGVGGMGVVFVARQVAAGREVALKMIRSAEHASAGERARFRAEAEAAAKLRHPGIVTVYEVGEHRGMPFFTLELCDGGSLAEKLDGTPWTAAPAARLVEMIADAIHAAHIGGVVHRDLKPANILLARHSADAGTVRADAPRPLLYAALRAPHGAVPKVTDFGISKRTDSPDGPTATGAVMGTPSYMAPEQASGDSKRVGPTADVWALGAILYELLTGRPPFKAATVFETLELVKSAEPVAVRDLNPTAPRDLETVAHKCLQKEPAKRYASAAELADDLRRFQEGRPITARPVGAVERGWRWCRRNPVVAGLTAAVFLVLAAGAVVSTVFGLQANAEATKATKAKKEADDNADRANAATDRTRRLLHSVRMGQVSDAFGERKFARLAELMAVASPTPGEPDLRGWEWHCLDRLMQADEVIPVPALVFDPTAVQTEKEGTVTSRLSGDGTRLAVLRVSVPANGKYRCDFWDLAARTPRREAGGEFRAPETLANDWKFTPDLRHVVGIENVFGPEGVRTGRKLRLFETRTGRAVAVPVMPYSDDEITDVTAVAEDGGVIVVAIRAQEPGVNQPLTEEHRNRFARWGRDTGRWTKWEVPDVPVGKDGKPLASHPLAFAASYGNNDPLVDSRRLLFRTDFGDTRQTVTTSRWQCWDFGTDPPKLVFAQEVPGDRMVDMVLSENRRWVAVASADGVKVCRAEAGLPVAWEEKTQRPTPGPGPVPAEKPFRLGELAAVSNDGQRVLFSEDGMTTTARLLTRFGPGDVRGQVLPARAPVRAGVELQFNADGTRLLAMGTGGIHFWDTTADREMSLRLSPAIPPRPPGAQEVVIHPDLPLVSSWVQTPGLPAQVITRDAVTGEVKHQLSARVPGQNVGMGYGVTPAGPRAVAWFSRTPTTAPAWQLLDPARGFVEVAQWTDDRLAAIGWTFDGPLLVGSSTERTGQVITKRWVTLRDAATGAFRCEFVTQNPPLPGNIPDDDKNQLMPLTLRADPTGRHFLVRMWKGDYYKFISHVSGPVPESVHMLRLFDTATGQERWRRPAFTVESETPQAVMYKPNPVFTPDGEYVVAAASVGTLPNEIQFQVFRSSDGETVRRFRFPVTGFASDATVSFSPDGRRMLYVAGVGGGVVDFDTGTELFRLHGLDASVLGATFSPDGERLFVYENTPPNVSATPSVSAPDGWKAELSRRGPRVQVWDTRTGQRVLAIPDIHRPAPPGRMKFKTPEPIWFRDGKLFVATDGGVRVFDGNPRPDR